MYFPIKSIECSILHIIILLLSKYCICMQNIFFAHPSLQNFPSIKFVKNIVTFHIIELFRNIEEKKKRKKFFFFSFNQIQKLNI